MEKEDQERLARVDANVEILLKSLPMVHRLNIDSAVNKREHKIFISMIGVIVTPALFWVCKKLGIEFF